MSRAIPNRDPRDNADGQRDCDHPACSEAGVHPAPRNRYRLRDYYWFCKVHAREYNTAWNYCEGMSTEEIDRLVRSDAVWGRRTWPLGMRFGAGRNPAGGDPEGVRDPFGFFDEDGAGCGTGPGSGPAPSEQESPDAWAMHTLNIMPPVTLTEVKARYKDLAKQLHPDVSGGDKAAEERLKDINRAYATLKTSLSVRPEPAKA